MKHTTPDIIFGRKLVLDLLDTGTSINKILIAQGTHGTIIDDIVKKAKQQKIVFSFIPRYKLDIINNKTQGVAAFVSPHKYAALEELIESVSLNDNPLFCVLDGITDPHNFGAIARSAYALGVSGIIIPKHNSCGVTSTVVKTSSGAIEHLPVCQVTNITRSIEYLKKQGFWVICADMKGTPCNEFDFKRPVVLVFGSEGKGVHRLVKENCDEQVSIPLKTEFDSLNVSCAAAVLFYEIGRQKDV